MDNDTESEGEGEKKEVRTVLNNNFVGEVSYIDHR